MDAKAAGAAGDEPFLLHIPGLLAFVSGVRQQAANAGSAALSAFSSGDVAQILSFIPGQVLGMRRSDPEGPSNAGGRLETPGSLAAEDVGGA